MRMPEASIDAVELVVFSGKALLAMMPAAPVGACRDLAPPLQQ